MNKTAAQIIQEAYDPYACEACDIQESTCWECAQDALEEVGLAPLF